MIVLTRKKTNFNATPDPTGMLIMPLAPNAECDVLDDNVITQQWLGDKSKWIRVRVAGLVGFVRASDVQIKDSGNG